MTTSRAARLPFPLAVFGYRATWGEMLYALLGLPLGVTGFVFAVVTVSVGAGLGVTFVGLPLLAVTGIGAKLLADVIRRLANSLTGTEIRARPTIADAASSRFGWVGAQLTDVAAWKARAYLTLKLPLGILSFVATVTFYVNGLGLLSYPIWRPFLPCNTDPAGGCHRGMAFGNDYFIDTTGRILLVTAAGAVLLLIAPWITHTTVLMDNAAMRGLLGNGRREL
jgi:hypothetical protein